jgi:ligand-binding sensor domain-containing protein
MLSYFLKSLLFMFLLLSTSLANSGRHSFDRLLIRDGLSQSSVFTIIQDHLGFMWIGTLDGLNRFDGYNFEVFRPIPGDTTSISHNSIFTILEDSKFNIWIGTLGGGLNKFDRNTNSFIRYKNSEEPGSLSNNNVRSLFEDSNGTIWVGTDDGLNKLVDGKYFLVYRFDANDENSISNNTIWDIEENSKSNLFIGTYAGINIFDINANKFERIQNIPGKDNSLSHDYVWDIELLNDTLAIIAADNGLSTVDLISRKFTRYPINTSDRQLLDFKAWSLFLDNSNLWVGTLGNGVAHFSLDQMNMLKFNHLYENEPKNEESISQNYIWSIIKDMSGIVWIGTDLGLNRTTLRKGKFTHIKSDPYLKNTLSSSEITTMVADGNKVWVGTRQGLNKFDPTNKNISNMQFTNDGIRLSNLYIRDLLLDSNNQLWIGTDGGGLTQYNVDNKKSETFMYSSQSTDISSNNVTCVYEDSQNNIWVGTLSGLNLFDRTTNRFKHFISDPSNDNTISHNYIYSIYEDKSNNLWIGTLGGGINLFNKTDSSFIQYKFDDKNGSSPGNNYIWTIFQDSKDRLWFGTNSGLEIYDRASNKITKYYEIPKIVNDAIYGILEDNQGNLWLSSNRGLFKFSPDENRVLVYDYRDGLQSNQFHGHAFCKTDDGRFYFGGINGFNYFYPDSIKINEFIPPVNISRFEILNHTTNELRKNEINYFLNNNLPVDLHYNENSIIIEFAAQNFVIPEKNQYAYKLEGVDDNWIYSGTRRLVTYANLDPGNYLFRVKASNNDGIWNEEGLSIPISIIPPFWMTWWFLLLVVIVIIGIILLIIYDQFKHYLEIERLRVKIAEDLHDDIGTRLTEISMLTDVIAFRNTPDRNENTESITKVGDIARDLIDNMSDIVWLINPKRDSLYELLIKLRVTYEEILAHSDIALHINNLDFLEKRRLPIEYRKNLYLIFKEAFNNSLKHSNCTEININASMSGKVLEIELEDNGNGFDVETFKKGNGLNNMKNRANQIGGIIEIASVIGSGSKIIFRGIVK